MFEQSGPSRESYGHYSCDLSSSDNHCFFGVQLVAEVRRWREGKEEAETAAKILREQLQEAVTQRESLSSQLKVNTRKTKLDWRRNQV
jgi:endo-1,4-beta-D-glucanase Y